MIVLRIVLSLALTLSLFADPDDLELNQAETGHTLDWMGKSGYTYFIQHSSDLNQWHYAPLLYSGADAALSHGFHTPSRKAFLRLVSTDQPTGGNAETADFDGDGLSNKAEITSTPSSSPFEPDTDGDGLNDRFEIHFGLNPTTKDSNGNGRPDAEEDSNGNGTKNGNESGSGADAGDEPILELRTQWWSYNYNGYSNELGPNDEPLHHSISMSSFLDPPTGGGWLERDSSRAREYRKAIPLDNMSLPFEPEYNFAQISTIVDMKDYASAPETWTLMNGFSPYGGFVSKRFEQEGSIATSTFPNIYYMVESRHHYVYTIDQPLDEDYVIEKFFLTEQRIDTEAPEPITVSLPSGMGDTMVAQEGLLKATFTIPAGETVSNIIEHNSGMLPDPSGYYSVFDASIRPLPVDLKIIHPATGELKEEREEGGYVAILRDEDTPVTELEIPALGGISGAQFRLDYSAGGRYEIYKNAAMTDSLASNEAFDASQDTTLYLKGLEKSTSLGGEEIKLEVQVRGDWIDDVITKKLTIVEAEFDTWINIFIPMQWADYPVIHPIHYDIIPGGIGIPVITIFSRKIAGGDDRDYTKEFFDNPQQNVDDIDGKTSSRVHTQITLIPFKDLDDDGVKGGGSESYVGETFNYEKSSSVPDPSEGYSRTNNALLPNPVITGQGRATPTDVNAVEDTIQRFGTEDNGLRFSFSGSADNPVVNPSPAIDWDIQLEISVNGQDALNPTWSILGHLQDAFPAYEIYMRDSDGNNGDNLGTTIYRYNPEDFGRTPEDLFPAPIGADQEISPDNGNIQ